MTKPIKPSEVVKLQDHAIPDSVFEAFNELIAKNFRFGSATVLQKDVVQLIVKKTEKTPTFIYANHWLDVERHYQEVGWIVDYDKPGFNESYEPKFTFSEPKKD